MSSRVVDRVLVINNSLMVHVSSYKLFHTSKYFRHLVRETRKEEFRRINGPPETRLLKLLSLPPLPMRVKYANAEGLLFLLDCISYYPDPFPVDKSYVMDLDHVQSVLMASSFFQVQRIRDAYSVLLMEAISPSNVWRFWPVLVQFPKELVQVIGHMEMVIRSNFLTTVESPHFLSIDLNSIIKFLKDDQLNIPREFLLFSTICQWIEHNQEERKFYFAELLACLRLGRISHDDLSLIHAHPITNNQLNEATSQILTLAYLVHEKTEVDYLGDDSLETYFARPRIPHSAILVFGGWEGGDQDDHQMPYGPSTALQVYNRATNNWQRSPFALEAGHAYSGCVVRDEKIYLIGGYMESSPTAHLKVYNFKEDEEKRAWRSLSTMHERRNYVCACIFNDLIYALGGHDGKIRLRSVERYDCAENNWSQVTPMRHVRSDAGAAAVNDRLYVVGGFDGQHFYDSAEYFQVEVNQWTLVTSMRNIRSGVSCAEVHGKLYVMGGNDGLQRLRTVERFNEDTNQWQIMPSMLSQRSNFSVAVLNNSIYAIGGWSDQTNSTIAHVEKWNPAEDPNWISVSGLNFPSSASCACIMEGVRHVKQLLKK